MNLESLAKEKDNLAEKNLNNEKEKTNNTVEEEFKNYINNARSTESNNQYVQ